MNCVQYYYFSTLNITFQFCLTGTSIVERVATIAYNIPILCTDPNGHNTCTAIVGLFDPFNCL